MAASLDRPLAAMLTITRAMSRMLSLEMRVEDDRAACWVGQTGEDATP